MGQRLMEMGRERDEEHLAPKLQTCLTCDFSSAASPSDLLAELTRSLHHTHSHVLPCTATSSLTRRTMDDFTDREISQYAALLCRWPHFLEPTDVGDDDDWDHRFYWYRGTPPAPFSALICPVFFFLPYFFRLSLCPPSHLI